MGGSSSTDAAVLSVCQSAVESWNELSLEQVSLSQLEGGISAIATYLVTVNDQEAGAVQPRKLVVRLHNGEAIGSAVLCDCAAGLAGEALAAPMLRYSSSSHSPMPRKAAAVSVYDFMEGGSPEDGFVHESEADCVQLGALVKRLHAVDPTGFSLHSAALEVIWNRRYPQLGLTDAQVDKTAATLGAYPLALLELLDKSRDRAPLLRCGAELFCQFEGAVRQLCWRGGWLRGSCTSRLVLGHADLHNKNILRQGDQLYAIDFEMARMMPAALDLSCAFVHDPDQKTYASTDNRRALLAAYDSTLTGEQSIDELWDLEAGVVIRSLFIAIVLSFFSDRYAAEFLR